MNTIAIHHLNNTLRRIDNHILPPMPWREYHDVIRKLIQGNAPAISANTMDSELKNLLGAEDLAAKREHREDQIALIQRGLMRREAYVATAT